MRLPEERVELIHKLSKESDIYERLARAIGNRRNFPLRTIKLSQSLLVLLLMVMVETRTMHYRC